jgi:gastric triacylglycerol lipase
VNLYSVLDKLNILNLLKSFNIYDLRIIDPTSNETSYNFVNTVCNLVPFICKLVFSIVSDKDPSLLDIENMAFYLQHYPANSSVKCLEHFDQLIKIPDPTFRKFDYGEEENLNKYGTKTPPDYDVSKVKSHNFGKLILKDSNQNFFVVW